MIAARVREKIKLLPSKVPIYRAKAMLTARKARPQRKSLELLRMSFTSFHFVFPLEAVRGLQLLFA